MSERTEGYGASPEPRAVSSQAPRGGMTEADVLAMLRDRYTEKAGNGDVWAFMTKVRDAAGFSAKRTIDALAMSLWPSRGLLLHGFEVKCSRSDWLRELKNPEKAEAFGRVVDFFYLVVADEKMVKPGELPEPWGMLAVRGSRLVQVAEPTALHDLAAKPTPLPEGVTRSFLAALLRSSCRSGAALPEELQAERGRGYEAGEERGKREIARLQEDVAELRERERAFHRLTGVSLSTFRYGLESESEHMEQIGRAVRAAMTGEQSVDRLVNQIKAIRNSCERLLDNADQTLVPYLAKEPTA